MESLERKRKLVRNRFCDVEHQTATELRMYREGFSYPGELPRIGSIILINEVIKDPFYCMQRGEHLCALVQDMNSWGIICKVLYSEDRQYTRTFAQRDFLKGLYVFKELEEPMYVCNYNWEALSISS